MDQQLISHELETVQNLLAAALVELENPYALWCRRHLLQSALEKIEGLQQHCEIPEAVAEERDPVFAGCSDDLEGAVAAGPTPLLMISDFHRSLSLLPSHGVKG